MSHHSLATIWAQLETRTDIDNLFCEMIGQYSLESSVLLTNSAELLSSSLHLVVFFKVIFDLQRTYSQGSRQSSECTCLLRPQQLLLAIVYLLGLKCRIFHTSGDVSDQHVAKRSFIVQTLVSGLRALWLRRYPLTPEEKNQLRSSFHEAWDGDELIGLDSFLIQTLCPEILQQLFEPSNPPSELSYPACKSVTLRDYSTGLYPLESRPDELVTPVKIAASFLGGNNSDWFRNYWIAFDIAWTTEAALIQLSIHASRPIGSAKSAPPTEDDINQLSITRRRVLDAIFGSQTIKEVIKDSVAVLLLSPCALENCICIRGVGAQSDHLDTLGAGASSIIPCKKANTTLSQFLDSALARVAKTLEYRKEDLRDCNGDLSDISESLDKYMDAWFSDTSTRLTNGSSHPAQRTAYIVPCPNLHLMPYDVLKGLVEHSEGKIGLTDLENDSPYFRVDICCSQCPTPHRIDRARQVEPLHRLAAIIKERLYREPSHRAEWQQRSSNTDRQLRNTSSHSIILSRGSSVSNDTSLSEKNSVSKGPLTDFFDEPLQRSNGLRVAPSYCFSADGQSLLLWMRYGSQVVFYNINSGKLKKFPADNVNLAAVGANHYAVISSKGDGQNIYVYARKNGTLIKTSVPPILAAVYSVAFSRNDKFIALGFASDIWIYVIETHRIICHELPCKKGRKPQCQRASFSADSEKIIVATRYPGGDVCSYVSECIDPKVGRKLPTIQIPTLGNDFDLSSVLYDNISNYAFLTSFTRKTSPVIFPPEGCGAPQFLDKRYNRHLGTQIQCAALCPSGAKLALVNDKNEIFTVRKQPDALWHVEKMKVSLKRKSIVAREDMMAMVMPNEDIIHLFWIKGAEWILMTI